MAVVPPPPPPSSLEVIEGSGIQAGALQRWSVRLAAHVPLWGSRGTLEIGLPLSIPADQTSEAGASQPTPSTPVQTYGK